MAEDKTLAETEMESGGTVEYPVSVTLRFRTAAAKGYFLGGLSDAWGEDVCDLDWPADSTLKTAGEIMVTVLDGNYNEVVDVDPQAERMARISADIQRRIDAGEFGPQSGQEARGDGRFRSGV